MESRRHRLSGRNTTRSAGFHPALPASARSYLARMEELAGVPIDIVSTGPDRSETIILHHPYD